MAAPVVPPKVIRDAGAIVVAGSLNPPAVQPWWLAHIGLISSSDAENTKVEGISSEFSVFELSWVRIEVLRERFSATALNIDADKLRLRDLVGGVFSALPHTPVTAIGINRIVHYEMSGQDQYHSVGHRLAPKEFWRDYVEEPGLKNLTIVARRPDGRPGEINISVKPILSANNVIEISYNSHLQFKDRTVGRDAAAAVERDIEKALESGAELAKAVVEKLSAA